MGDQPTTVSHPWTLEREARRYVLRNPLMENHALAKLLDLDEGTNRERGRPPCCFYAHGKTLAVIRMNKDLIVFDSFVDRLRPSLHGIADRVDWD